MCFREIRLAVLLLIVMAVTPLVGICAPSKIYFLAPHATLLPRNTEVYLYRGHSSTPVRVTEGMVIQMGDRVLIPQGSSCWISDGEARAFLIEGETLLSMIGFFRAAPTQKMGDDSFGTLQSFWRKLFERAPAKDTALL